jgi:hypothetical protein
MLNTDVEEDRAGQSAAQIKKWLKACIKDLPEHNRECTRRTSPDHPKRLMEIDLKNYVVRLIRVETLKSIPEYVALSYCWGPEGSNFKTTEDNLYKMEKGILIDELPQTLKDVVEMVSYLDLKYLWVDAVCIVQDNDEWDIEAEKMGGVYVNAHLVISATASPSVHSGLYAEQKTYSTVERTAFHHIMRSCRTMPQRDWDGRINDGFPLLCRAWAFQERILSRRIVHFTMMELIWECLEDRWCECKDQGKSKDLSGKINNLSGAIKACIDDPDPIKFRPLWRECVQSYSKRTLSKPDDRLIAISGVASLIRGRSNYDEWYLSGLWKDALPWDLLWFRDQTSTLDVGKPRSPSWSWSSVDGGIEWPTTSQRPDKSLEHLAKNTYIEHVLSSTQPGGCIKSVRMVKCTPIDQLSIITRTRLASVVLIRKGIVQKCEHALETSWTVENKEGTSDKIMAFYPDISLRCEELYIEDDAATPDSDRYYYAEVLRVENEIGVWEAGLVVRPVEGIQNTYERVGVAGNMSCTFEEDAGTWYLGDEDVEFLLI